MANNYLEFSEILEVDSQEEADWIFNRVEQHQADENNPPLGDVELEDPTSIWFHADEFGDIEGIAKIVQEYLIEFNKPEYFTLTYAETCSKPREGEFGGGAVIVSQNEIKYLNAHSWVEEQIKH
jgi:hypothetical protein